MDALASQQYFETEVLTATPQKLQLLLIEGALRDIRHAQQSRKQNDHDTACELLIHAQDVIGQLLTGFNRSEESEIVGRLSGVYFFVLRQLMDANMTRDDSKLEDAARVLEVERETWRQVCERFGSKTTGMRFDPALPDAPVGLPLTTAADAAAGSFSVEA
jgi:flagellar protein FliS